MKNREQTQQSLYQNVIHFLCKTDSESTVSNQHGVTMNLFLKIKGIEHDTRTSTVHLFPLRHQHQIPHSQSTDDNLSRKQNNESIQTPKWLNRRNRTANILSDHQFPPKIVVALSGIMPIPPTRCQLLSLFLCHRTQ